MLKCFRFIVLCVVFNTLISCESKSSSNEYIVQVDKIDLDSDNRDKTMLISELYDIESYIQLNTGDSIFVGEISKMIIVNSNIWIMDRITNSVLGFTDDGNLVSVISNQGEGPGEYKNLSDVAISDKAIYIADGFSRRIYKYTWDGDFLSSETVNFNFSNFEILDSSRFVFFHDYGPSEFGDEWETNYNISYTNQDMNVIGQYLPNYLNPNPQHLIGNSKCFSRYNNNVSLIEPYRHVIYSFKNNGAIPYLEFSITESETNKVNELFNYTKSNDWNINKTIDYTHANNMSRIVEFQENSRISYITYFKGNYCYFVYYDRYNNKALELQKRIQEGVPPIALINDIDNSLYYPMMAAEDEFFYSYSENNPLKLKKYDNKKFNDQLINQEDNMNPVIVKFKVKEF